MFGKLKDWRRIHTRYDRCAHTFMSASAIAATVVFWLGQRVLSLVLGGGAGVRAGADFLEKKVKFASPSMLNIG